MKKRFFMLFVFASGLLFFVACNRNRNNFDRGIIPTTPVNFSSVNSEYDDYNSAERRSGSYKTFYLCFSTNRNSHGANFDFLDFLCDQEFDKITGAFVLRGSQSYNHWFDSVNTSANELGPYIPTDSLSNNSLWYYELVNPQRLYYASDVSGNLDIMLATKYGDSHPISAVNSQADDAYPSIYRNTSSKVVTMYFCSNREKNFDIYQASDNTAVDINQYSRLSVQKVESLSSSFDDKCPFIYKNTMVFVSNRPGGMGGFDLWYATFNGTSWSEPKNFGSKINTPYDEYRPIVIKPQGSFDSFEFVNDLMIFSSNRPGGKGGFDLYYVGINKNLK